MTSKANEPRNNCASKLSKEGVFAPRSYFKKKEREKIHIKYFLGKFIWNFWICLYWLEWYRPYIYHMYLFYRHKMTSSCVVLLSLQSMKLTCTHVLVVSFGSLQNTTVSIVVFLDVSNNLWTNQIWSAVISRIILCWVPAMLELWASWQWCIQSTSTRTQRELFCLKCAGKWAPNTANYSC